MGLGVWQHLWNQKSSSLQLSPELKLRVGLGLVGFRAQGKRFRNLHRTISESSTPSRGKNDSKLNDQADRATNKNIQSKVRRIIKQDVRSQEPLYESMWLRR